MDYDPIKDKLGAFFKKSPGLQKFFFRLLDLLLLRAWHIHRELKQWARYNPGHKHILDAGSGFGQYSYFMARNFPSWSIVGIDVKQDYVCNCNNFFRKINLENAIFKTSELTKYKEADTYDLVLSVDVMEHILEDVQVFQNLYDSLKKDGMILISTPSDQGGSDVQSDEDESFIGEHVRDGYNIQDIKDKLKSVGFSKVKTRYAYGTPGQISWRLSMKYPILMLNTSKLFAPVVALYYLIIYPVCYLLNYIDSHTGHITGTGLIVKAWK